MSQGCAGLCCQDMIQGQAYTFHFNYSGFLQLALNPSSIQNAVAKDGNFSNPSASVNEGGLLKKGTVAVSFTYAGQGSLVGQAGQEMQNVINNFWTTGVGTSLVFDHATTGVAGCSNCCCCGLPDLSTLVWIGAAVVALLLFTDVISLERFGISR